MSWTEDRIASLTSLWGEGKSASEIATFLGSVTRNAVIGKVHRLGLDGRPSPIKGPMRARVKRADPARTGFLSRTERMCKWPIGDPRLPDFHFCSEHATVGLPYCSEHAALAYQPARRNSHNHGHQPHAHEEHRHAARG